MATPAGRPRSTTSSLLVREGEVVGIAGVEGNGQAELVDAVMGLRPLAAGTSCSAAGHQHLEHPRPARGGLRVHPGGPAPPGHAARGAALGEPHPRPPDPAAGGEGLVHRPQGRPHRHRPDHEGLRRPRPGAGHPGRRAVRGNQQKLIVGREMESKPAAARRRAPDARRGRRGPGGDLGAAEGRTSRRDGDPADLRRPRRADRSVGHAEGDAPRPARGHARPRHVYARAAGWPHDRRTRDARVPREPPSAGSDRPCSRPSWPSSWRWSSPRRSWPPWR